MTWNVLPVRYERNHCKWLMAWQIRLSSVCRLWRACTLLRGFNFSEIFCTIMAIRQLTCMLQSPSPTKNHEDRPRGSPVIARFTPSEQISITGVWLCNSSKPNKQEGGGQTQTGESGLSGISPIKLCTLWRLAISVSWWVSCSCQSVHCSSQDVIFNPVCKCMHED